MTTLVSAGRATGTAGHAAAWHAVVVVVVAVASAVLVAVEATRLGTADGWIVAAVIAAWAAAAAVLAVRRPRQPLALLVAKAAGLAAVALAAGDGAPEVRAAALGLGLAAVFHLAAWLPDGRLSPVRVALAGGGYVAGALCGGVLAAAAPDVPVEPLVVTGALLGAVAAAAVLRTCRRATSPDRARLQWVGWAGIVTAGVALAAAALSGLTGWPADVAMVVVLASVVVPVALVLTSVERSLDAVGRALVHTIVITGMVVLVTGVYVLVVVGFRGLPEADERPVLALSMVAAGVIAVFSLPSRRRLESFANQRVYGEREAPDVALRTFANRMSRAVPMDELLLQLAETLRKTMALTSAEVWTGSDGVYERAVSVPDAPPARITLGVEERRVAARAQVSGNAWLAVWVPALVRGDGAIVRAASVVHLGELNGFIVVRRSASDTAFDDEQDRVLTDIARQLGLALHNVRLDAALQASLDELQVRNRELVASRARIVAAADESRRRIERNLHDGAQQHLVAMAVKLGLARQLLDTDPAMSSELVDELREDVQATLRELRELAHGIYPPLLRTRGLPEALVAAANRAVLPTSVEVDELPRFDPDVEAAVYFCCLEAIQNAGKHAGDGACVTVWIGHDAHALRFAITDDGAGFDPAVGDGHGHGFVNMEDRLGAIGGALVVTSAPGAGTTVSGVIPMGDR